ncbi:cytochrome ubiquinol oxidase subunit I [Geothrix sp. PMB-07]|uniref:cytochrome ubiquinol oxidase subunit I n=1 Tax=Geothrix sp. PMB-07 TaxID=3068640 RepID=UPI0027414A6B|nr:cytochrome ubiquinol oxidase subunit I [Geothrix sp. PMB-07]WLT32537.1 cytochrome ubiquinol oxidase subunit I [Geothrix sp. PMB-07]
MGDPLFWHRLQFGFTATYHYLFPQLTMGLAFIIVVLKALGLKTGEARYNDAARFWIRIFGINFAVGVVTGIPLEFQFGTNWARFSRLSGGIIGQTLGMEGMFAFFLESSFLGLLIWGEKKLSPKGHFGAAVALWLGSWLSGFFIVATNAFMQHPVGYTLMADGTLQLQSFSAFLMNPWAHVQYAHTMIASVVTGSFVVAAIGAYWTLKGIHQEQAKLNLRVGTILGLIFSVLVAFPTGDLQGKQVAKHQPVTLAAMEGRFESGPKASLTLIGQPDVAQRKIENPVKVPAVLSFIAYGTFSSNVKGLLEFPEDQWPQNIELLYYSFHIMAGLGTLMIALMALAALLLWKGKLDGNRPVLWALMLAFPFPYIATTAGWAVAEFGRQPWLIYGVLRTVHGASPTVHAGHTAFTTLGFAGIFVVLSALWLFLIGREIAHGPASHQA